MGLDALIAKWSGSSGAERANKDSFVYDLCDALDVPRPDPTTGDPDKDAYVFERDAVIQVEGGKTSIGKIDLYKRGCFVFEAKQGSDKGAAKIGTARRGTPGWNIAMRDAYGQALSYARTFDEPVPFLVVCDIGHCFDLYAAFDGSYAYRPFPNAQSSRIFLKDATKPEHAATLRACFADPHDLDPSRHAAKVTREVATHIAELAKALEAAKHPPELVAKFLMRCLFTMFAEDVELMRSDGAGGDRPFTWAIENLWSKSPASFPHGIEDLWRAMNEGSVSTFTGKLLKFNGGLFVNPTALPVDKTQLALLLEAAKCDWSGVEPAIFGTLLERALDPKERHALGAHYTPRAYVERLVRPTIEEPLRADWDLVQAEVRQLVAQDKVKPAIAAAKAFHRKLCETKVLDPACGSGNFLYVTLDLFKRLEGEVLGLLDGLGERQQLLGADTIRVTPAQFLGIEVKPWAKEIAELVLWIGYLQHHVRAYGKATPPPEPVLQDYRNIECRDAVLAWDDKVLLLDESGKPVTRWDGETTKTSPVTGEQVPDEEARVPVYRYVNPRKAEWPKADFIVGNPPFVGSKRMRATLGDGYVDALRSTYDDVVDAADFVLYWWARCARAVAAAGVRQAGLITTNSITSFFNKRLLTEHLTRRRDCALVFAIPDHPWIEATGGAAVRIAMTVIAAPGLLGRVLTVTREQWGEVHETADLSFEVRAGAISDDLAVGPSLSLLNDLRAVAGLSANGVQLYGGGFILEQEHATKFLTAANPKSGFPVVRPFVNGRDLAARPRGSFVIDFFGTTESEAREIAPDAFQHLLTHVKPERDANRREPIRRIWWRFGWERPVWRAAARGLTQYIGTCRTAKHRVFMFLPIAVLAESKVVMIASNDASHLGVLSSRLHVAFAERTGGWLGVGNDPTYNNADCFNKFPFPAYSVSHVHRIGNLGERLDAHRKRQQSLHPDLTITGMYNVLEKLRSGEALSAKDKVIHEQGLVSVLKQIHDDLDAAVFDAYGWPHDLTDEQILEKLVALNAERAEEERNGLIRWLRPEFQNPSGKQAATQTAIESTEGDEVEETEAVKRAAWPKKLPEQLAAVRDLVGRSAGAWTVAQVVAQFEWKNEKKRKELVAETLESLGALGLVVRYEADGEVRWRGAVRGAA